MPFMYLETFPKNYNDFKVFLFNKIEKISLALYLCTNHLEDSVSLKSSIRSVADILIKDILVFNRGQSNLNSTTKIKEDFLELKSLLSISMNSGLISRNNISILLDEINKLTKEVENQKDNFIGEGDFKKSFFLVEAREKILDSEKESVSNYKGHKGQDVGFQKSQNKTATESPNKRQQDNLSTNDRTEEIMKIIKDNEKVTIKDISSKINNCSEKTIQRELIKMVSLKLIKKEGERRWSNYSLI